MSVETARFERRGAFPIEDGGLSSIAKIHFVSSLTGEVTTRKMRSLNPLLEIE
jgi:hypothetical protein